MADLSAGRLQIHKPSFFSVGIDYFGSFLIKRETQFSQVLWLRFYVPNNQSNTH